MTPEQQAELRKPFPPECIGKLPKAGTMLDFVGHAHVTDRLLSVDPEWTWEPLATNPAGEPMLSNNGMGLWIRLTVAGVTRLGYGDVEKNKAYNAKELISDALRNAGMRFGIALDLWAKTELESAHVEPVIDCPEACGHTTTKHDMRGHLLDVHHWVKTGDGRVSRPRPTLVNEEHGAPDASPGAGAPEESEAAGRAAAPSSGPSPKQLGMMHALLGDLGVPDDDRHRYVGALIGREVASMKDLSKRECSAAIDALKAEAGAA